MLKPPVIWVLGALVYALAGCSGSHPQRTATAPDEFAALCAQNPGACPSTTTPAGAVAPVHHPPRPSAAHLTVEPSRGGRHDRFAVTITTLYATGVFGKTQRSYSVEAHAAQPASACVNNRDGGFVDGPAGARVTAQLDPARGEGGLEGWCPGRFNGTVTYFEAYACPPAGVCHPPPGYPTRHHVVARFSVRVH